MKRIILFAVILEISYLTLSFILAQWFGQWSYTGEILRTGLRVISIGFYANFYQKHFYKPNYSFNTKELLTPQFTTAILLFLLFAVAYSNAQNETVLWQIVFVISGIAAGFREELFYRGIVQNALQSKYGYKIALPIATLLFTLSHVQYIYNGQTGGLLLITLAGIIFGCIFIYTGSMVFTAAIHGLYDALLSVDIVPFRLSNNVVLPMLLLISIAFLILISKNPYGVRRTNGVDSSNKDNLRLG
ncbi:MAG: type II CAAX endopeptidase family protein [Methyloglobulus sp.]